MKVLIFDTETTGTPKNYKAPITDLDNWPRVIQLAWQVYDIETEFISANVDALIQPHGWVVPTGKFWVDNGFYTAKNEAEGMPMATMLDMFIEDYEQCDFLAAHNIAFDYPVLGAEMLRYNKRASKKLKQLCTMQSTIDVCQIPFPNGGKGFKFPKLIELHNYLFAKGFDGAHDAGSDVSACRICLVELVKRDIIKLN